MSILNKITFKNIAKGSIMSFVYAIFPFLALLIFYSPLKSISGLLFSYLTIMGTVLLMKFGMVVKNKTVPMISLVSEKIKSINDENTLKTIKVAIKATCVLLLIGVLYITFSFISLFLNLISIISVLNFLMIISLNIYYIAMTYVIVGCRN